MKEFYYIHRKKKDMKLQLDLDKKTITVEGEENVGKLFETLEKMLPDWKDFTLKSQVINNWTTPIVIDRWHNPYPWVSYYQDSGLKYNREGNNPFYVGDTNAQLFSSSSPETGVLNKTIQTIYNVEI